MMIRVINNAMLVNIRRNPEMEEITEPPIEPPAEKPLPELNPCPICKSFPVWDDGGIICDGCGLSLPEMNRPMDETAELWNTAFRSYKPYQSWTGW